MQEVPYSNFVKLSKDKRESLIEKQKQGEPEPVPLGDHKYPDADFIKLIATQEKKSIKLATYRYPAEETKAVVIFFHTMAQHLGVTAHVAAHLAKNGFTVCGYDQRGHGRSEGEKGYLDNDAQVLKDAQNFIDQVFKMYPDKPIFLLGHGLGGLLSIVLHRQGKMKFAGILLFAPALKKPGNKIVSSISGFALKLLPNSKGLFAPIFAMATRNPNSSEYLQKDPLVYHDKVVVGTLIQMSNVMEKNSEDSWKKLVTPPIAIVQGQYDRAADPINSITFFEQIKTEDKEFWWYPDMWNMIWLEKQVFEIQDRIVQWLSKRL